MKLEFYHHKQESPRFKLFWRHKKLKETFDIAVILLGHWFGIFIDYSKEYNNE